MNINQLDGTPSLAAARALQQNVNEACNRLAWLLLVAAITFKF